MPAQTPIDRQSLKKTLADRYESQPVGGAFDAKGSIKTEGSVPIPNSFVADKWTAPGFKTNMQMGQTQFSDTSLNIADSLGLTTKKYKS